MTTSPQDIQNKLDLENGTRRTTINGTKYSINMLPALPAYLLGTEIMETLLPAVGNATDNGINYQEMFPEDRAPFTQMSLHLVKSMKNLDKATIINSLLEGATADGKELDINTGMRGKTSDIAFLVEFALKENFTDFFIEYIKERVTGLVPMMASLLPEGFLQKESSET
jgi:hypothetical protein